MSLISQEGPLKQRFGRVLRLFFLCIILVPVGSRANVSDRIEVPEWTVLQSGEQEIRILIETPEIEIEEVHENGQSFHRIRTPTAGWTGEVGKPELPVYARFVAVPPGASVEVTIEETDFRERTGIRVRPTQNSDVDKKGGGAFTINQDLYDRDAFYPQSPVETGPASMLRNRCVVPLIVYPVQYNPRREVLNVCRSITVRLSCRGVTGATGKSVGERGRSEAFEALYKGLTLNYQETSSGEVQRGGYLIITPDQYEEALGPLVDWKRQKGHHTDIVTSSQIAPLPDFYQIRSYIQDHYQQSNVPLEYVILVGDVDEMPCDFYPDEMEDKGIDAADHPYAMMEGDDYFPDILVGRLSVSSINEIRTVVNKIVSYESDPYMGQTGWYNKALMVCNYGGNASAKTTKQWVRKKLLENGFTQVDTSYLYGNQCEAAIISSIINSGVSFINYRGYLDWGGWTSAWFPPVNFDNIYRLHNGFMLPILTDMVCNAADFYEFCPAEAWLRAGSVVVPKGAVAIVGPTAMNTKVYFNNVMDAGFYAGVFDDSLSTPGQALARAKMELYMQYPLNRGPGHAWNSVECYFYMYTLIGDPGLQIWTDIPQALTVHHPTTLARGASYMDVTVENVQGEPLDKAYVCLTDGEDIISGGFTSADGNIGLPASATSCSSLTVTVTRHNFVPYQASVLFEETVQYVGISDYTIDDDSDGNSQGDGDERANPGETIELALSLQNTGSPWTAYSVSGRIYCDDPYVTLLQREAQFGDLSAGESGWGQPGYLFSIGPSCPDGHQCSLTLVVSDMHNHTWNHLINIEMEAPSFSAEVLVLDDTGEIFPNHRLDPGETVQLVVSLVNTGNKTGEGVQAALGTADENISLIQSTAYFGSIDPGAIAANEDDPFVVSAALGAQPGQAVRFNLHVESNSGMLDMSTFTLQVGLPATSDPVGPDTYGYYAFDESDWFFRERPSYDWIEIDPAYGGPGTVLNLIDQQGPDYPDWYEHVQGDIEVLPLPFGVQYYGDTYDHITVCSNGWLSFCPTWMTSFRNWGIPAILNPPCLIAPFWDDLYLGDGCVVYYHDEAAHRFIVQWSRVYNEYNDAPETFQAILYDPEYYPTGSGDSEILFQYETIDNGDYAYNFATVGIEAPDKNDGLQYTYAGLYSPGAAELRNGTVIKFTTERHPHGGPSLNYYGCYIDDDLSGASLGDGDGLIDAGERFELRVRLINLGEETAEEVAVTLRSTDPCAIIEDSLQTYPDMAPGDTASNIDPLVVLIDPACEDGHVIEFELHMETSGIFHSSARFQIDIVAPQIIFIEHSIQEFQGDGDDRPESEEIWQLQISLRNEGQGQATDIRGQLLVENQYVSIQTGIAGFSDMEPHGETSNHIDPFVFSIHSEAPYHSASFLLSVSANNDHHLRQFPVEIIIGRADILLIDDDGGDDIEQWYHMACAGQVQSHERHIHSSLSSLESMLSEGYRTLIWFTGSERDSTLTPSDQERLKVFLDGGGSLFLSGQNIASDLQGTSFLTEYLHARCLNDSSADIWMNCVPGEPIAGDLGLLSLVSGNYGAHNQTSPDEIEVLEGASPVFTYYSSGHPAALRYMNGYRLVFFAFGFESFLEFIDVANAFNMRADMLGRILSWFQFEPQIGDVNEDGTVNILDIIRMVNIILGIGGQPTAYQTWAADYTGDGGINVLDVMGIVNTILDGHALKSGNHDEKNLH